VKNQELASASGSGRHWYSACSFLRMAISDISAFKELFKSRYRAAIL
jgi:hypothetical protein